MIGKLIKAVFGLAFGLVLLAIFNWLWFVYPGAIVLILVILIRRRAK